MSASQGSWLGALSGQAGTATGAAGVETLNAQAGQITTESLATAAGAVSTRTLNNTFITATSQVMACLAGGSNTTLTGVGIQVASVAAGVATLKITNGNAAALNGTVVYNFIVV